MMLGVSFASILGLFGLYSRSLLTLVRTSATLARMVYQKESVTERRLYNKCLSSALLKAKTAFRQQTQDKRIVTSRVDCLLETVFQSQGRRNVLEGKRKDLERGLQQGTSGRFTTRTEDLCTVQQKAIVQCPLVCSWGC
jgi:hypothetical protein